MSSREGENKPDYKTNRKKQTLLNASLFVFKCQNAIAVDKDRPPSSVVDLCDLGMRPFPLAPFPTFVITIIEAPRAFRACHL